MAAPVGNILDVPSYLAPGASDENGRQLAEIINLKKNHDHLLNFLSFG
jgi:hypothetical protein